MSKTELANALSEMGFTKCPDNKYRRCDIHDFMNIVIDSYGHLWVNAELQSEAIQIPITMFKENEIDKFKQWMILTHAVELPF
jgi:hypothetical protein